jgi:hypothetical protein
MAATADLSLHTVAKTKRPVVASVLQFTAI